LSQRLHPSNTRILIADENAFISDKLVASLQENGFIVKSATTGAEALAICTQWKPHFVLYDLLVADLNGPSLLKELKAQDLLGDDKIRVFMMSAHNTVANVKESLKHGATDYLVKPVKVEDLVGRLVLHMQPKRQISDAKAGDTSASGTAIHFMHLTELLLREGLKLHPLPETLYRLTGMLSLAIGAVRVSVVEASLTSEQAFVRGSSDKRDIDGFKLDLNKYPEIIFVLRSEKTLALDNLKNDPTMAAVATQTKSIQFNAMIVCPIRFGGQTWGVLSARLPETKTTLSDFEIRFAQLAAHVAANSIVRGLNEKIATGSAA
jgi:DNA-binding response OmpR family regulator